MIHNDKLKEFVCRQCATFLDGHELDEDVFFNIDEEE